LSRLRRQRLALASGAVFCLLVAACLAAPVWAGHIAHTGPDQNHITDTVEVDGRAVDVVSEDGVPIGPTWGGRFFLGADSNGRDTMVRLLYGGRNSLLIGLAAALITTLLGSVAGLAAGYLGGWTDGLLSRLLDLLWAFPAILLGVALGTALAVDGLRLGPVIIEGGSLAIPVFVISVVYIPYLARPIRAQTMSLREREFIQAARAVGMSRRQIVAGELLPNVLPTILVLAPLLVANAILLEAALSFLGAGIQPPNPSWGTMISIGVERIVSAPYLAIAPGLMLLIAVLSLNGFAEGVRSAAGTRSSVRVGR
jgi:peptide/nickel transport system permease protein